MDFSQVCLLTWVLSLHHSWILRDWNAIWGGLYHWLWKGWKRVALSLQSNSWHLSSIVRILPIIDIRIFAVIFHTLFIYWIIGSHLSWWCSLSLIWYFISTHLWPLWSCSLHLFYFVELLLEILLFFKGLLHLSFLLSLLVSFIHKSRFSLLSILLINFSLLHLILLFNFHWLFLNWLLLLLPVVIVLLHIFIIVVILRSLLRSI